MNSPRTQKKENTSRSIQHPLFGISLKNWVSLLEKNDGVDRPFIGRAAFITVASLGTAPVRLLFQLKYKKKINDTSLQYPPVFIIGHWRSGTTYLHELLSQDPQFCHVSLWNTLLPDSFLILETLKPFLVPFLPSKRPMDEIAVEMDGPYEDEAALAVLSPWSFFHCLHFPRNAEEQYLKSIHFQHLTTTEIQHWKHMYLNFLKTVSFANQGKRLLSKNPPNTARITTLLELFPEARFIHIYRSPYKVYLSTMKMRKNVLETLALQNSSEEEIEHQVIQNYQRMMTSYFEQKEHIPPEQLVEIKYEELIADPVKHIQLIYSQLKLPGVEKALPEMKKYLEKQADYKTNKYTIDKKIIEHVNKHWKFTIDHWRYTPPK
jgi:omega-hydroxy-beta-dihydromenaquinone-9 sulfotransferase